MEKGLIVALLLSWFVGITAILLANWELKRRKKEKHT